MSNTNLNLSDLSGLNEQKLLSLILIELRIMNQTLAGEPVRDLEEARSHEAYNANTPVIA